MCRSVYRITMTGLAAQVPFADVILADILSNGRFDLGVGQGYTHDEFNAFCIDRKERAPRMAEGFELMRRLFTEENVTGL